MATVFDDVAPWPERPLPADATIGHNKPPIEDDVRAQFREALLDERPDFLTRVDQIEGSAGRVTVTNEDELGRAGDLVKMIRAATTYVEGVHKAVKAPYLAAGRTCDLERKVLVERLEEAKRVTERPMNAYVAAREAERRAAEEALRKAEREAAEAAAASAAPAPVVDAPPPPAEPTRSDGGTTISTRQVWHAEIEDFTVAFIHVEDDPRVREAVQKAIDARVRAGVRKLDGVRIYSTTKAVSV
jgi:hypothetical protein